AAARRQGPPPPALSPTEIEKVRVTTRDTDPTVRWAAIELLYRLRDPHALQLIEDTLTLDTDPDLRQNALSLLQRSKPQNAMKNLLPALRDSEVRIRIAALVTLGEVGDAAVTSQIAELLNDSEPSVRLQALHTLAQIQERKRAEYEALNQQLRASYEKQLKQSGSKGRRP
ncbi:MAG: HEAT repeat domain-containing protein, partial [Elusimicrobia bacterium]|nr:HEAT repeat domain-containing protein [Elusimicrobiota bacterium]